MKRALIFSPYFEVMGGGEVYSLSVAQVLEELGYEISFAAESLNFLEQADKYHSIKILQPKLDSQAQKLLQASGQWWQKKRLLSQYEIIFFVSDGSLPWLFGKRNWLHFQVPFTKLNLNLANRLKMISISNVICNSKFTAAVIEARLQKQTTVIYPPVDPMAPKLKKQPIILSVGRFTKTLHNKRQDILIQAFKEMVDAGLNGWRLCLVGTSTEDDAQLSSLKKLAANYPIDFLVGIDRQELLELYAKASIFWHATGYDINEMHQPELVEHFGISTVEAMAAGCIPVVIDKGGQKEIVTDKLNGYTFSTQQELVNVTLMLLEHPKALPVLAKNARKRAEEFTYQNFKNQIQKLLKA